MCFYFGKLSWIINGFKWFTMQLPFVCRRSGKNCIHKKRSHFWSTHILSFTADRNRFEIFFACFTQASVFANFFFHFMSGWRLIRNHDAHHGRMQSHRMDLKNDLRRGDLWKCISHLKRADDIVWLSLDTAIRFFHPLTIRMTNFYFSIGFPKRLDNESKVLFKSHRKLIKDMKLNLSRTFLMMMHCRLTVSGEKRKNFYLRLFLFPQFHSSLLSATNDFNGSSTTLRMRLKGSGSEEETNSMPKILSKKLPVDDSSSFSGSPFSHLAFA